MNQIDDTTVLVEKIRIIMPEWADDLIEVAPIEDGITNRNFKISVNNRQYFLKLCAKQVGIHGIDRCAEYQCMQYAAIAGIGPKIIAYSSELDQNVTYVIDFVDHEPLSPSLLRDPHLIYKMAKLIKSYHTRNTIVTHLYDVFHILDRYLKFALENQIELPTKIASIYDEFSNLKNNFYSYPVCLVTCHNDLRASNFLLGKEKLMLVDWEYAGMNDLFFDLGNLSESNFYSENEDEILLASYFDYISSDIKRKFKIMKAISLMRDGMWSIVHSALSSISFNYMEYGREKLREFERIYNEIS